MISEPNIDIEESKLNNPLTVFRIQHRQAFCQDPDNRTKYPEIVQSIENDPKSLFQPIKMIAESDTNYFQSF